MKLLICLVLAAIPLAAETWTYWLQPCDAETARQSACEAKDSELARWALDAWQKASDGAIQIAPAASEQKARLRIYWASANLHLYGETRPMMVDGKRGAAVFILPDLAGLGPDIEAVGRKDKLYRDSIVYLTFLHESGHALGLGHTRNFDDIMYSFRYGGDIVEYFGRYRRTLKSRQDIRSSSGMSSHDRESLHTALREGV